MRNIIYLTTIIILTIVVCSCTITKRHFGKGYHIEWHKKTGNSGFESTAFSEIDSTIEVVPVMEILPEAKLKIENDSTGLVSSVRPGKFEQHILKTKARQEKKATRKEQADERNLENEFSEESGQKVYPLTWFMMGTLSLIVICYFLGSINPLFFGGIILFAFLGLIFGIWSRVSLRKHPEKYKNKKLTKVFSTISIISGGVIIAMALIYFLTMN